MLLMYKSKKILVIRLNKINNLGRYQKLLKKLHAYKNRK